MITAHPVRQRVGMIVASGSFDLDCNDVKATGWFQTSVSGSKGRASIEAWRDPRGGLLEWLGAGDVRPWNVSRLELEVDVKGIDAALGRKRAASVRAGYAEAVEVESVRGALVAELGGRPVKGDESVIAVEIFPGRELK